MASVIGTGVKLAAEQVEKRGLLEFGEKSIESILGWARSSESSIGRSEVGRALLDHLQKFEPYNKRVSQDFLTKSEQALASGSQAINSHSADMVRELSRRGARVRISPSKTVKLRDAINAGFVNPTVLTAYDEKIFQRGTDLNKQAINHLVQSGQVRDAAAAWDALKSLGASYHGRDAASSYLSHGYSLPMGKLDPATTLKKFALDAGRKITEVDAFGPNDEALNAFIESAKRSAGPVHADAINEFLTVYLKDRVGRFAYQGQDELERRAREKASWVFTSRIAIPHITQWLNEGLHSNMSSMFKATSEMMQDYEGAKAFALRSGAMIDELRYELEATARGDKEGIIGKILHQPFFKKERQIELIHSAVTGKHELMRLNNILQKNPDNKEAQLMMKFFGVDYKKVLSQGGLTQNELLTAGFRSAQETMYIRTARHTPYKWEQNWVTRLASMYKHFMFNEAAHIAQSLKRSYQIGPASLARQIAYIGMVFPAAGYMIQLADNFITGHEAKDRSFEPMKFFNIGGETADMVDDYLNAISHMAGFGLATSMLRSAKNRNLSSFAMGPIFSSVVDVGQDAYQAAVGTKSGKHNIAPLGRDVLRKIPLAGPAISHYMFPPKKDTNKTYY